jgi:hypothetical protein
MKQFSPHDTATRYMRRMARRSLAKHSNITYPTLAAVGSNNNDMGVLVEQSGGKQYVPGAAQSNEQVRTGKETVV